MENYICKFCNKNFKKSFQLGGHVSRCKYNPKYEEYNKKNCEASIISSHNKKIEKFGNEIIKEKECYKCRNKFFIKERERINKEKYYCSRKCANSRNLGKEIYQRISEKLKKEQKIYFCKECKKQIKTKNFCSQKCLGKFYRRINLEKLDKISRYRKECCFKFNIYEFPEEFDLELVRQFGWYKAKNKGNNFQGVCRDHIYSIKKGFVNNIDSKIISHPANCQIIKNIDNLRKNRKCEITIEELIEKIEHFNKKYAHISKW